MERNVNGAGTSDSDRGELEYMNKTNKMYDDEGEDGLSEPFLPSEVVLRRALGSGKQRNSTPPLRRKENNSPTKDEFGIDGNGGEFKVPSPRLGRVPLATQKPNRLSMEYLEDDGQSSVCSDGVFNHHGDFSSLPGDSSRWSTLDRNWKMPRKERGSLFDVLERQRRESVGNRLKELRPADKRNSMSGTIYEMPIIAKSKPTRDATLPKQTRRSSYQPVIVAPFFRSLSRPTLESLGQDLDLRERRGSLAMPRVHTPTSSTWESKYFPLRGTESLSGVEHFAEPSEFLPIVNTKRRPSFEAPALVNVDAESVASNSAESQSAESQSAESQSAESMSAESSQSASNVEHCDGILSDMKDFSVGGFESRSKNGLPQKLTTAKAAQGFSKPADDESGNTDPGLSQDSSSDLDIKAFCPRIPETPDASSSEKTHESYPSMRFETNGKSPVTRDYNHTNGSLYSVRTTHRFNIARNESPTVRNGRTSDDSQTSSPGKSNPTWPTKNTEVATKSTPKCEVFTKKSNEHDKIIKYDEAVDVFPVKTGETHDGSPRPRSAQIGSGQAENKELERDSRRFCSDMRIQLKESESVFPPSVDDLGHEPSGKDRESVSTDEEIDDEPPPAAPNWNSYPGQLAEQSPHQPPSGIAAEAGVQREHTQRNVSKLAVCLQPSPTDGGGGRTTPATKSSIHLWTSSQLSEQNEAGYRSAGTGSDYSDRISTTKSPKCDGVAQRAVGRVQPIDTSLPEPYPADRQTGPPRSPASPVTLEATPRSVERKELYLFDPTLEGSRMLTFPRRLRSPSSNTLPTGQHHSNGKLPRGSCAPQRDPVVSTFRVGLDEGRTGGRGILETTPPRGVGPRSGSSWRSDEERAGPRDGGRRSTQSSSDETDRPSRYYTDSSTRLVEDRAPRENSASVRRTPERSVERSWETLEEKRPRLLGRGVRLDFDSKSTSAEKTESRLRGRISSYAGSRDYRSPEVEMKTRSVSVDESKRGRPKDEAADEGGGSLLEIDVPKGGLGLGFCIEGGKDGPYGDRPITVKRLFRVSSDSSVSGSSSSGSLQAGDEILSANGRDMTLLSRFVAWNYLKTLPEGVIRLVVRRRPQSQQSPSSESNHVL